MDHTACTSFYSPLVTYGMQYLQKLVFIDTEYCIYLISYCTFVLLSIHIASSKTLTQPLSPITKRSDIKNQALDIDAQMRPIW